MSFPARSDASRLLLQLVVFPVAGCGIMVALFTLLIRPRLGWEPWLLDVAAVLCGALGILLGGGLGFRLSGAPILTGRRIAARAVGPSAAALLFTTILIGTPAAVLTTSVVAGFVAVGSVALLASSRRHGR